MKLLYSKRIFLRGIEAKDLNERYLGWLNDSEVNRYLETRFSPETEESIYSYWKKHHNDSSSPWFAICLIKNSLHIGNIKIGPINWFHRNAYISLMIGDKNYWGKGYATEAIELIRDWAFKELDLSKLKAGIYSTNISSRKAFEKSGFELEGTLQDEVFCDGKRIDTWLLGLSKSNFSN